ncbi:unnamed protein product [Blepharisma stoltei]|uniref:Uncharacterized protein n=1 Tax=Blepharisma stoltei TaxID=1481888 RepID=A0AAU9JY88_9CILI|nr:unnamed protein product [Blepharisma stoltei]
MPKKRTMTEAGYSRQENKRPKCEVHSRLKTISHINIQGIKTKGYQVEEFIKDINPDIIGFCELYCEKEEELPQIRGYRWVMSSGTNRKAGLEYW